MFWSKKKKKKLPDLPSITAAPSMKEYTKNRGNIEQIPLENEIHNLPSFPDSPMKKGFSQSAIKNAVSTEEDKDNLPTLPNLPETPEERKEIDEWAPQLPGKIIPPKSEELEGKPNTEIIFPIEEKHDKREIYVKLEEFQKANNSMKVVEEKIKDIEKIIETIKEVKENEDRELDLWDREIETIKARISGINKNIFDKDYS